MLAVNWSHPLEPSLLPIIRMKAVNWEIHFYARRLCAVLAINKHKISM